MANVLIIDDSQSVRTQLRQVLEQGGHSVDEGADGNQGYDKIVSSRPDLVITDYNMPGNDGITMLEKARESIGSFSFPIFMLTTETSEQLKASGKAAGVKAWIVKPFNPEKLLAAVNKVTG